MYIAKALIGSFEILMICVTVVTVAYIFKGDKL